MLGSVYDDSVTERAPTLVVVPGPAAAAAGAAAGAAFLSSGPSKLATSAFVRVISSPSTANTDTPSSNEEVSVSSSSSTAPPGALRPPETMLNTNFFDGQTFHGRFRGSLCIVLLGNYSRLSHQSHGNELILQPDLFLLCKLRKFGFFVSDGLLNRLLVFSLQKRSRECKSGKINKIFRI